MQSVPSQWWHYQELSINIPPGLGNRALAYKNKEARYLHSNTIWRKCSGTCIVVESTEIIICSYVLQACVIFEGMDSALVFHSLRATNVVVVRKEKLLGAMKLPTPAS